MPIYMHHIKDSDSREDAVNKLADHFEKFMGRRGQSGTYPEGHTVKDFDIHSAMEHPEGGHQMIFSAPARVGKKLGAERVHDSELASKLYAFRQ